MSEDQGRTGDPPPGNGAPGDDIAERPAERAAAENASTSGERISGRLEGIVTALAPGLFEVAASGQSYLCTLRGRLRKPRPVLPASAARRTGAPPFSARPAKSGRAAVMTSRTDEATNPEQEAQRPTRIAPGDRVRITPLSPTDGVIEEVLPRRTVLSRSRGEHAAEHVMLANPDVAVLVFATQEPQPHFGLLDRYLALCERASVRPVICMNKDDLGVPGEVDAVTQQYATLGYPVLYTSAATGDGLPRLRELLAGKISLLSGESGVGKSSLTNLLALSAQQRTGEISQATGLGRHTTTGVRLLPLPGGGWLADSAGIRELSLWNVPPEELARCFVELRPSIGECLYEDCTHSPDEEGCALRGAMERGTISPSRWASFERLLADARAEEKPEWASR